MKMLMLLFVNLVAMADFAIVTKVKGKAYQTKRGDKRKVILKKDDKIFANQIISTKKRSVVKLKFDDGATMTIGQKSSITLTKIKVGQTKKVTLLDGYIRSKFNKLKSDKRKIIVKTRTAALGVRGTEFNIIYNKDSNVTTAISFSGDVEFTSAVKDNYKFANDKVSLRPGEFSSTFKKDDYVSKPVKMSPQQFAVLRENSDLRSRDKTKLIKKSDVAKIPTLKLKKKHKQNVPRELLGEGYGQVVDNLSEDDNAPRPGGYVDFNTGVYIEPPESAEYDEEAGVFTVPSEFGGIDPETGEYVPPLGLILHPLKGFMIASTTIETGVKFVRDNLVDVSGKVVSGVTGNGL